MLFIGARGVVFQNKRINTSIYEIQKRGSKTVFRAKESVLLREENYQFRLDENSVKFIYIQMKILMIQ